MEILYKCIIFILENNMDKDLIKAEQRACTTDCICYRKGTCPYRWNAKMHCPLVQRFLRQ